MTVSTQSTHGIHRTLVTSIGRKVPLLKCLRQSYEKAGMRGVIVGADVNPQAIGRYFVDDFWHMPPLDELTVDAVVQACHERGVRTIIPTRDGELAYFAKAVPQLAEAGIDCMVSAPSVIQACYDKLEFYTFGEERGFPTIPTYLDLSQSGIHNVTWVVKERFGSGSRALGLNLKKRAAAQHAADLWAPIFQPYIEGKEYSVDVYVTRKKQVKGVVVRSRDVVIDGESQVTTVVDMPEVERLCAHFAESLGLYGHVVFQVLIDAEGRCHVIECNARFGGASTLAYQVGLHSFAWFLRESMGESIEDVVFQRDRSPKTQIRFPEDWIL